MRPKILYPSKLWFAFRSAADRVREAGLRFVSCWGRSGRRAIAEGRAFQGDGGFFVQDAAVVSLVKETFHATRGEHVSSCYRIFPSFSEFGNS